MAQRSKIEWTDATWNPIRGCSRVSEGCRNCYAERVAARFSGPGQPYDGLAKRVAVTKGELKGNSPLAPVISEPRWTGEVRFIEEHLADPLRWKKPRRIFVNSMSDLFHENVQDEWIDRIFAVMAEARRHVFQILTKRPKRMREYMNTADRGARIDGEHQMGGVYFSPLPNVWLGVSVEDQKTADERIPLLLQTPAVVRWVSYEPALGPMDLTRIDYRNRLRHALEGFMRFNGDNAEEAKRKAAHEVPATDLGTETPTLDALNGRWFDGWDSGSDSPTLDWIVCGGESGPGARPMHPDWARGVRDQCQAAGVPFFMKQICERGQTIPFEKFPKGLQIREYPRQ